MIQCRLCGDAIDLDSPSTLHSINPLSLRQGWMHDWCLRVASEDAHGIPVASIEYQDRYDQWLNFEQHASSGSVTGHAPESDGDDGKPSIIFGVPADRVEDAWGIVDNTSSDAQSSDESEEDGSSEHNR